MGSSESRIAHARRTDAALESHARVLLTRYGVLFRDLLTREPNAPKWRDLTGILRRLEARGEIRGGRFVTGFTGEQFALPDAVDSLRAARTRESQDLIAVSAADPMNLAGIVLPAERVAAIPGRQVRYRNGLLESDPNAAPEQKADVSSKLRSGGSGQSRVPRSNPAWASSSHNVQTEPTNPTLF